MPSHTWNELGLWDDAVRSNTIAWHSDQKAAYGKGFAIYPTHNLTMLYAASMGGQSTSAIQAAKNLAKLNGNTAMLSLALIRFGRFDEVLQIDAEPNGEDQHEHVYICTGLCFVKRRKYRGQKHTLDSLWELTNTTTARFRFHDGKRHCRDYGRNLGRRNSLD